MIVTNAAAARCAANVWARAARRLLVCLMSLSMTAAVCSSPAIARTAHAPARIALMARGGCAHAHAPVVGTAPAALRRAVVCLINRQRLRRGLPRLHENRRLNASAQAWTNQMVTHDVFSHGASFAGRITAVGFDWQSAGENIASGFRTPAAVVRGWMASPEHCRNILTPRFLDVGVGVSGLGVGRRSGPGTWTEDFGLPVSARAPSGNWGPADHCPY